MINGTLVIAVNINIGLIKIGFLIRMEAIFGNLQQRVVVFYHDGRIGQCKAAIVVAVAGCSAVFRKQQHSLGRKTEVDKLGRLAVAGIGAEVAFALLRNGFRKVFPRGGFRGEGGLLGFAVQFGGQLVREHLTVDRVPEGVHHDALYAGG